MTEHEHEHGHDRTDRADGAAHVSTGTSTETGDTGAAIPELVIISGMSGAGRSTAAK